MSVVRVYCGPGVSPEHYARTLSMCQYLGLSSLGISSDQIRYTEWEQSTKILIIPGGSDCPYAEHLHGKGAERVRNFVSSGGVYIGLCAGSYFGSGALYFEENTGEIIEGKRELAFFPGVAKGPAYSPYDPFTNQGVRAVCIDGCYFYYNGGNFFENAEDIDNTEILARYVDGRVAAVRCKFGDGVSILIGFHPEISFSHLDLNDRFLKDIIPLLKSSEVKRKLFLLRIFKPYISFFKYCWETLKAYAAMIIFKGQEKAKGTNPT